MIEYNLVLAEKIGHFGKRAIRNRLVLDDEYHAATFFCFHFGQAEVRLVDLWKSFLIGDVLQATIEAIGPAVIAADE